MKEYPITALRKLTAAIRGEEGAQKWLVDNDYRELSEFWDAYEDVEKSFQWLKDNKFIHFAALVDAMSGNQTAKAWLARNGFRVFAALVDAAQGNKNAVMWISGSGNIEWLEVAKALYEYEKKRKKKNTWNIFGNPFS